MRLGIGTHSEKVFSTLASFERLVGPRPLPPRTLILHHPCHHTDPMLPPPRHVSPHQDSPLRSLYLDHNSSALPSTRSFPTLTHPTALLGHPPSLPPSLTPSLPQVQQDCDDDGEAAAGGRLLHLLQIVDAKNVVTRKREAHWFCGMWVCPRRWNIAMKCSVIQHPPLSVVAWRRFAFRFSLVEEAPVMCYTFRNWMQGAFVHDSRFPNRVAVFGRELVFLS